MKLTICKIKIIHSYPSLDSSLFSAFLSSTFSTLSSIFSGSFLASTDSLFDSYYSVGYSVVSISSVSPYEFVLYFPSDLL